MEICRICFWNLKRIGIVEQVNLDTPTIARLVPTKTNGGTVEASLPPPMVFPDRVMRCARRPRLRILIKCSKLTCVKLNRQTSCPPRSAVLSRQFGPNSLREMEAGRAPYAPAIRVNQQQVNALGQRVGVNRPDLQYTAPSGNRVYIEYDNATPSAWPNSPRGPGHGQRILANDPNALFIQKTF